MELAWVCDGSFSPIQIISRPLPEESTIGKTLVGADIVSSRDWTKDPRFNQGGFKEVVPGIISFLNIPLLYHGAAIGCLNFEWRRRAAFTATDVQRVHEIADYITPVIQTERWLRAIADLRERLQFYNFSLQERLDGRFIAKVVAEIHDVLAPLGTLLLFEFGFSAQWAMAVNDDAAVSSDETNERRTCQEAEAHLKSRFDRSSAFVDIPISLIGITIGKIVLATPKKRDDLDHPSLTADTKQRSTIAVLVKDALLDLHRTRFGSILHDFHGDLDAGGASEAHWLRTLRDTAGKVGLRSVAVYPDKTGKLRYDSGQSEALNVAAVVNQMSTTVGERRLFRDDSRKAAAQPVLELRLPLCGEIVYLQVDRNEFGAELAAELPWKVFIDRLADAADSALVRIRAIELESEAMQFEMNSLLVHELRNPAEEFQQAVEWLDENLLAPSELPVDDPRRQMFDELKRSAHKFMELANAVVKPVVPDDRAAVPLKEVREHVERLYLGLLATRGIGLYWEIEDRWMIGVPLHLAYIVIVSLVQNAREAIGFWPGRILIRGEEHSHGILLHVDDTGSGIRREHRKKIFKLGFTTKRRGSGRGLVLAQQALHRHHGDLHLAEVKPDDVSTRFTIRFPGAKHEK